MLDGSDKEGAVKEGDDLLELNVPKDDLFFANLPFEFGQGRNISTYIPHGPPPLSPPNNTFPPARHRYCFSNGEKIRTGYVEPDTLKNDLNPRKVKDGNRNRKEEEQN